jgi:hypothetical protein
MLGKIYAQRDMWAGRQKNGKIYVDRRVNEWMDTYKDINRDRQTDRQTDRNRD